MVSIVNRRILQVTGVIPGLGPQVNGRNLGSGGGAASHRSNPGLSWWSKESIGAFYHVLTSWGESVRTVAPGDGQPKEKGFAGLFTAAMSRSVFRVGTGITVTMKEKLRTHAGVILPFLSSLNAVDMPVMTCSQCSSN